MRVTEIWRYPVKTMAGESLSRIHIGPFGLKGDRLVHVEDARGRVVTSRSHPRFLGHKGTIGPGWWVIPVCRPWSPATCESAFRNRSRAPPVRTPQRKTARGFEGPP
jgi:uncharacterized protein